MSKGSRDRKPGRPPRDWGHVVGEQYGNIRVDALAGRDARYRQLVHTTCLVPDCGNITVKRLDKLLDGTTISCGCVKRVRYLNWLGTQVSNIPAARKAEIWVDAQTMARPALLRRHKELDPIALDTIVREEQRRRLQEAPATGQVQIATQAPDMDWADEYYLTNLRILHATVSDVGFGTGKRQRPIFNSRELTLKRNGDITGMAAELFEWAAVYKTKADPETTKLINWLIAKIDETREHRKVQRANYSHKAVQKK